MEKFLFLILFLIVSCNIYSPFTTLNSDEDRKEQALKCLHDDDYDCAIEQYDKMTDVQSKSIRKCMTYISKGGMGLKTFLDVFMSKEDINYALGRLAQTLAKNTSSYSEMETKIDALTEGKTACDEYVAIKGTSDDFAILFKSLSRFGHCAILMAKADFCTCTSDTAAQCTENASGLKDGLTKGDIYDGLDGKISSDGMCSSDATACSEDLSQVTSLNVGEFGSMKQILDQIPAELKQTGVVENTLRKLIGDLIPP